MLKIEGLHDPPKDSFDQVSRGRKVDSEKPDGLVITQLTAGVKNPNRVNVFVNNKYTLSLDVRQVIDFQVKVGRVLTEAELQELHAASEFGKLYQRALEWALTRPHSLLETRDYLKRRQLKRSQTNRQRAREELKPLPEIKADTMELVIERLCERGYVDDRKFAEYFVENRFIKKGVSKKRLQQELRKKGVSEKIIAEVFEDSGRDEREELMKMALKKQHRYEPEKLIQYLVRQGFDYQLVKEVVAEISTSDGFLTGDGVAD